MSTIKSLVPHVALSISLLVLVAASRFLPFPPNFTMMGAFALWAGAHFQSKAVAISLLLGAMLLSDAILGFHGTMPFVYAGFILSLFLGRILLRSKGASHTQLLASGLSSSLLFFVISNFGVWLSSGYYSKSLEGLSACYIAAIPFLHNTVLSTLLFSYAFFMLSESLRLYRQGFVHGLFRKA